MTGKRRKPKAAAHDRHADIRQGTELLLRATSRNARKIIECLLHARHTTTVDIDEWLRLMNALVRQLCAPLALEHVIVVGHGNLDDGLEVYTASGHTNPDSARTLLALGLDSYDEDDELCPVCAEEACEESPPTTTTAKPN